MKKFFFLLVTFLLLLPHVGFAADPFDYKHLLDFTPPESDKSIHYLASIFGVVGDVLHGTGSQIMGVMFKVFNSAVLALGGLIVSYTLFVSTLNTAHEGEIMGKKWSSIWIPVRSSVGVALLLPKTTGYCFVQVMIMWVVVQGVGMADSIWDAALHYFSKGGLIIQSSFQPSMSGQQTAKENLQKLMRTQVCMYALQNALTKVRTEQLQKDPAAPAVPIFANTIDLSAFTSSKKVNEKNNMPVPNTKPEGNPDRYSQFYQSFAGVCGNISWTPMTNNNVYSTNTTDAYAAPRTIALHQVLLNFSSPALAIVNNALSANPMAIGRCPGDSGNCAQASWGDGGAQGGNGALLEGSLMQAAFASYTGIISPSLKAKANKQVASWFNSASDRGWLLAGAYYYELTKLNNHASVQMDSSFPTVTMGEKIGSLDPTEANYASSRNTFCKKSPFSQLKTHCKDFYKMLVSGSGDGSKKNRPLAKFLRDSMDRYVIPGTRDAKDYNHQVKNIQRDYKLGRGFSNALYALPGLGIILAPMVKIALAMAELTKAQQSNEDPLVIVSRLGHELINLVTGMWLAGLVLAGAAGAVGAIPSVTISNMFVTAATWLVPFLTVVMSMLFSAGAILAYYVPLVPYIVFTFAGLGWFIGVIEAMVAAPIVAIGVLHPDGQHEIWGKADTGVMLLLNVFLRPGMMVIGFIAGISLSYVGVWVLNEGFSSTLSLTSPTFGLGAIWWPVFMAVIYAGTVVAILNKSFALIHILPDKILRWLSGGMAEALGAETAGEVDKLKGAVSSTGSQIGQAQGTQVDKAMPKKEKDGASAKVEPDKPKNEDDPKKKDELHTAPNSKKDSSIESGKKESPKKDDDDSK